MVVVGYLSLGCRERAAPDRETTSLALSEGCQFSTATLDHLVSELEARVVVTSIIREVEDRPIHICTCQIELQICENRSLNPAPCAIQSHLG